MRNSFPTVEDYNKEEIKLKNEPERSAEIVKKPKDVFCYENDDLTFQIKVSGNPLPKIYWFKNGSPLVQSDKCRVTFENNIVCLYINKLLAEDAASYTLLAENDLGAATFTINLRVHYVYEDIMPIQQPHLTQQTQSKSYSRTTTTRR